MRSSSATGGSSARPTGRSEGPRLASRDHGARGARGRRADGRRGRGRIAARREPARGFPGRPAHRRGDLRRAGQLDRFVRLVAIEYGRGVSDGRVTKDFEIQEAITFRDGAAAAFADLEPRLLARDRAATRRVKAALASLGASLVTASRGGKPVAPSALEATVGAAVDELDAVPRRVEGRGEDRGLRRHRRRARPDAGRGRGGDWGAAESARIEAYGIFELGPEQRLRGLAPSLFQGVESLFWYGTGDPTGSSA